MKAIAVQHLSSQLSTMPRGVRLLAIDHGTKTLGLAMCDPAMSIVTPHKTIHRTKMAPDLEALAKIIKDYAIGGIIIGWPLNMDGTEGPRTQSVRDWLTHAIPRLNETMGDIWWAVWDERLSSSTAHNRMTGDMQLTFAKRKQAVDSLAAHAILEDALSYITASL